MLRNIYLASAVFSVHTAAILYINSSFLGQYFNDSQLGLLYIIGAVINLILLSALPKIIGSIGIHKATLTLIILDLFTTVGLVLAEKPWLIAISFTLHQASTLLIAFMFDEYLEYTQKTEEFTGRIRSVFLTISSIAFVASPYISGLLVSGIYGFRAAYCLSLVLIIPLFLIVWKKMEYENGHRPYIGIRKALALCISNKNSSSIVVCRFILEFFYSWMIIYTAIYLTKIIGFGWEEIGVMFTIMLLPFVLFEIPLGTLSDKFIGEKEIMIFGFIVLAGSTAAIPFIGVANFMIWTTVLFMTRVGASFIEIGTESFFFKHIQGEDAGMISLFRATRPLAYIIAPAVATITLSMTSFEHSYLVLAAIIACGALTTLVLKDTK